MAVCGVGCALLAICAAARAAAADAPVLRVGLALHRSSVIVGGAGSFVVSAGAQEWRGKAQTWIVFLPSAVPAEAVAATRPAGAQVYLAGPGGAGGWSQLPVRVRADGAAAEGLRAGTEPDRLRRYEGALEVSRDATGALALVNIVDLEAYARGAIGSEMESNYPPEALKAQAVAARSEALAKAARHRADGFDLCAETHCQAYRGLDDQTPAGNAAVAATAGEVLAYNGRVADAVYHAACGGHTESARDAWGGADVPYLRGVSDLERPGSEDREGYRADGKRLRDYLTGAPAANCRQPHYLDPTRFRWVRVLTPARILASLADIAKVGDVVDLRPLERGISGRITRLEVRGTEAASVLAPESVIRRALGGLPSSAFVVDRYCDAAGHPVVFVLWGAGWGHGVGMCQAGAAGMALAGRTYREILAKYYPGTSIEKRD
jgi:SpoIID/LytB domain protein